MANSVKARFNDNCKIEVSMSDDTTVTKAVIIDADGVETEIGGGGGSSDFSTAEVTIIFSGATDVHPSYGEFSFDDCQWTGDIPSVESSGSIISIPIPQGESTVLGGFIGLKEEEEVPMTFVSITGDGTHDIIDETEVYFITGDCTITITAD